MPQRYFLDTSALVARYLRSATGYAWIGALCDPAAGNVLALVEITGAELAATFNQMVRGGRDAGAPLPRGERSAGIYRVSVVSVISVVSLWLRRGPGSRWAPARPRRRG
jgi:hypothetical protein